MLASAERVVQGQEEGRWTVFTSHRGRTWQVIVEPDMSVQALVIVAACSQNLNSTCICEPISKSPSGMANRSRRICICLGGG